METGFKIINNITDEVIDLPANQESIVIDKELSTNKIMSFTIFAVLNDRLSTSTRIDTTIPDFPYPKITGIKHIDKKSFEIYFEDRVVFERQIQFSLEVDDPSSKFVVENTKGVIKINTFGEYEALSVTFTADLSYGEYGSRYIPISLRPTLEKLAEFELGSESNPKTIDIRTIGNSLVFTSGNNINKADLTNLNSQPSQITSLPANINLLRLSNDNSKAFAGTSEETYHLVDVVNGSIENLNNLPDKIYDVSFIEDDTKIVVSSNEGLIVYSLMTNQSSRLNGLDTTSELEFSGDASQTYLLALDKANFQIHYFKTITTTAKFGYHNTIILDGHDGLGYTAVFTNVSHLNSENNLIAYDTGMAYEFEIEKSGCNSDNFVCFNGFYDPFTGIDSEYEADRNAYFQILDSEYRLASTENFLRIVSKPNLSNIHALKRSPVNASMLKVNYDNKVAVEFHKDTKTLVFYDLSKKWSFTNYGVYPEWVRPSN